MTIEFETAKNNAIEAVHELWNQADGMCTHDIRKALCDVIAAVESLKKDLQCDTP